ncbi:MAG: oligosaccharide flippase family protein [Lachnospiraceae bacterium]|nr:oligosaccharide flippase family protein [Lachnospiraceae bacterium]
MDSSRTKNSTLNLATTFGQQMLNIVLRFAVRTVFVYTLGKSYLGINGLFADILSMLSLAEFGFDAAIGYKLYKPLAEQNDVAIRKYLRFFKYVYRVVSLVILGIGILLIPFLPILIKDYERLDALGIHAVLVYMLYLLQSVSGYLFFAYRSVIIKADQKTYLLNTANGIVDIVMSVVQIAILLLWHNYILYIVSLIGFVIIKNLVSLRISQKRYHSYFADTGERLSREEIKDIVKDCAALFVFRADNMVMKATDNLILSSFHGLILVGEYSNYLMIYTMLKSILAKMYESVKASMGNFFAQESVERKYAFFEATNFITIVLYGTAGGGIAVVTNELIECWLGESYIVMQPLPILIGIELVFAGIKMNLNQIRNISGVFRQMWYRPFIGITINLCVSIIGVNLWGIHGVVVGTICSLILANFLIDPGIIHKHCFGNYRPVLFYYIKNLGYMSILLLAVASAMWICNHVFTGCGWWSVIFHGIFCGIYIPGILLIVYHRTAECKFLINKIKILKRN